MESNFNLKKWISNWKPESQNFFNNNKFPDIEVEEYDTTSSLLLSNTIF